MQYNKNFVCISLFERVTIEFTYKTQENSFQSLVYGSSHTDKEIRIFSINNEAREHKKAVKN